ncbi:MAG: DeoR/GlpR family DNA-binding transcription regulator [Anaerolineaceae bacterium]|jgi:DeoR/GlpR family transcriptional regulator of sugar metabolism
MLSFERHQAILDLLDKNDSIQVVDLVSIFNVSEVTIRRDLDVLERKGLLRRVHGGAVSNTGRSYEPAFLIRSGKHSEEKMRIGRAAAELIENGDSLMLDVGTTTLEITRFLTNHQNLTIITPSFQIAAQLVEHPGIRVILPGGILRKGELSLIGHLAESAINEFYVDKLFLAAGAVDPEIGFTEFNLEDTLVKRAMLRNAKDITALVDSSKFGKVALNAIASLKAVNRIISDRNLDPEIVKKIQNMNIDLLLV